MSVSMSNLALSAFSFTGVLSSIVHMISQYCMPCSEIEFDK